MHAANGWCSEGRKLEGSQLILISSCLVSVRLDGLALCRRSGSQGDRTAADRQGGIGGSSGCGGCDIEDEGDDVCCSVLGIPRYIVLLHPPTAVPNHD